MVLILSTYGPNSVKFKPQSPEPQVCGRPSSSLHWALLWWLVCGWIISGDWRSYLWRPFRRKRRRQPRGGSGSCFRFLTIYEWWGHPWQLTHRSWRTSWVKGVKSVRIGEGAIINETGSSASLWTLFVRGHKYAFLQAKALNSLKFELKSSWNFLD